MLCAGQEARLHEEEAFDIDAMEVRASEAVQQDYHGLDWQRVMEIAQGWRDLGYPEEDVSLHNASCISVIALTSDLDVVALGGCSLSAPSPT